MIHLILGKLESSPNRAFIKSAAEFFFALSHAFLRYIPGKKRCPVCNAKLVTLYRPVCGDELVKQWNLDSHWENLVQRREGEICISCGSSLRVRQLALALVYWINGRLKTSQDSVKGLVEKKKLNEITIAEINSCGALHKTMKTLPGISYSEFQPDDHSVRHENLMSLTYPEEVFDLVLHSDTLEHVPDVHVALLEIWRVLKPGGVSVFSMPIIRDGRGTIRRAMLSKNGSVEHLKPASFHGGSFQSTRQYLVFTEFGEDFPEFFKKSGFKHILIEHTENQAAVTIIIEKQLAST